MGFFSSILALFGGGNREEPPPRQEQPAPYRPERRHRKRINPVPGTLALIIDDSPTVVLAMKRMLESAGMRVVAAPDAEQGLDMAREQKPGLVFLDIILPGMNGFTALRHMRRAEETREIPVIMISGNEKAAEQFFGTRIGADDFMKKPFTRMELFVRIEHLLDEHQVPQRHHAESRPAEPSPTPTAPGMRAEHWA